MPGIIRGFITSVASISTGFVVSEIVRLLFQQTPNGQYIILAVNLVGIVGGIALLAKEKYWSILYLLGYMVGLYIFGRFFISEWEFYLYLGVGSIFGLIKLWKKIK